MGQQFDKLWERARPLLVAMLGIVIAIQLFVPKAEAHVIYVVNHHTGSFAKVDLDDQRGLKTFDRIAQDWRQKEICEIDRDTINWLHAIIRKLKLKVPTIRIVSGYRTPKTNRLVGGAKKSKHMECAALDFKIDGVKTIDLYRAAKATQAGGLGAYFHLGFIHIDSGRIRRW